MRQRPKVDLNAPVPDLVAPTWIRYGARFEGNDPFIRRHLVSPNISAVSVEHYIRETYQREPRGIERPPVMHLDPGGSCSATSALSTAYLHRPGAKSWAVVVLGDKLAGMYDIAKNHNTNKNYSGTEAVRFGSEMSILVVMLPWELQMLLEIWKPYVADSHAAYTGMLQRINQSPNILVEGLHGAIDE